MNLKSIFSILLLTSSFLFATCGDCPGCDLIYPDIKKTAKDITKKLKKTEDKIAEKLKNINNIVDVNTILELEIAKAKRRILTLQRESLYLQSKLIYNLKKIKEKE